jgi:hypothetical protein
MPRPVSADSAADVKTKHSPNFALTMAPQRDLAGALVTAPWGWLRDGAARAFGDTRSYAVPPRTRRSGARMQLPNARTLALASATDLHLGAV